MLVAFWNSSSSLQLNRLKIIHTPFCILHWAFCSLNDHLHNLQYYFVVHLLEFLLVSYFEIFHLIGFDMANGINYVCVLVCVCTCVCMCLCVCVCACVRVHLRVYVPGSMCVHLCVYVAFFFIKKGSPCPLQRKTFAVEESYTVKVSGKEYKLFPECI